MAKQQTIYSFPSVPRKVVDELTDEQRQAVEQFHTKFPAPFDRLADIHTYCRPHASGTVDKFVEKFLTCYESAVIMRTPSGEPMAVMIEVGEGSKTLFTSHVDTVHSYAGRQEIDFDHELGLMMRAGGAVGYGECLGADDGAGIWLMLEMIDAGLKGVYLFFYGEERGGIGSSLLAEQSPMFLKRFERAVAFDRKGTTDVITHQGMGRCCSDNFATALADALNSVADLQMAPDNGGVFTDTANFTHLIPECTNISCGYEGAHSAAEYLDTNYLVTLRDALLCVDWESLPTERTPEKDRWDDYYATYALGDYKKPADPKQVTWNWPIPNIADAVERMRFSEIAKFVKGAHHEDVAELIYELLDRNQKLQDDLYELEDKAYFEQADANDVRENLLLDDDDPQDCQKFDEWN